MPLYVFQVKNAEVSFMLPLQMKEVGTTLKGQTCCCAISSHHPEHSAHSCRIVVEMCAKQNLVKAREWARLSFPTKYHLLLM